MVDDSQDEILLTRRRMRDGGITNPFISERNPLNVLSTLDQVLATGSKANQLLLLVDLHMREKSGFDLIKDLRASRRYGDVKIIMLTNSNDVETMLEALELGANGYMAKPFSGTEFFAALSNVSEVRYQLI
ncbi:response regulator [Prosthecomicrobium sp. N25]|uniref:response regulator n=1 Tax=Prosthecomicrobium sp. N25 TaxID=3129254 RepID=UPI00307834C6